MSITDELREFAESLAFHRDTIDMMLSIADRIDAEHRAALEKVASMVDHDGWVELPVDADGVPIRVGDELDEGKVARIVITDEQWEPSVYVYKTPNVLHECFCNEVSHVQPDSWERIIKDAVRNGFTDPDNEAYQARLVERCRRLAGAE